MSNIAQRLREFAYAIETCGINSASVEEFAAAAMTAAADEIEALTLENAELKEKHWSECRQISAYDAELKERGKAELRVLKNFIRRMPKVYRRRNYNWVTVRDILMAGTNTAGMTSCLEKCLELGIDLCGYTFERVKGK